MLAPDESGHGPSHIPAPHDGGLTTDFGRGGLVMPPATESMKVIELNGTPFEMGFQHGRALKESIAHTVDVYMDLMANVGGKGRDDIRTLAMAFAEKIERFDPRYMEEIRGIVAGSELPLADILTLNARTEILTSLKAASHECTTFCFAREGILAQTWDWLQRLEGRPILLRISHPDGHTVLTMTEPGIIGKIGINSAGLGVGLNILTSSKRADGVPVHLLLRSALDSRSWDEAYHRLMQSEIGTNSAITLANDQGKSVTVEYQGGSATVIRPSNEVLIHTNHYLDSPDESPFVDSMPRLVRAQTLVAKLSGRSVEAAKELLSDRMAGLGDICVPWRDEGAWGYMGTLCSLVMDLKNRTLYVSRGHPAACEDPKPPMTNVDVTYDHYSCAA